MDMSVFEKRKSKCIGYLCVFLMKMDFRESDCA